jgi:hypothetical protein
MERGIPSSLTSCKLTKYITKAKKVMMVKMIAVKLPQMMILMMEKTAAMKALSLIIILVRRLGPISTIKQM